MIQRIASRGLAFVGLCAVGPMLLWACEDDSTTAGPGPVATTPTPTTTTPTNPTTNPTTNPPGDSGTDTGPPTEEIPNKRSLKLLNLGTETINACIKSTIAGSQQIGPLFRAAGIPPNSLSARIWIDQIGGNGDVKIIKSTDNCDATALSTVTLLLGQQASDSHLGVYYTGAVSSGAFVEHLEVTAGKESVMTQRPLSNPLYNRDDGVGGEVNLRLVTGDAVLLDPGVTGKITLQGGGTNVGVERKIKTLAGGTLSIWVTQTPSTQILLCDERAPSQDGLANCALTLRAP